MRGTNRVIFYVVGKTKALSGLHFAVPSFKGLGGAKPLMRSP